MHKTHLLLASAATVVVEMQRTGQKDTTWENNTKLSKLSRKYVM